MRTRTLCLAAVSGLSIAVLAAACSGNGGSGSSNAVRCQINWTVLTGTVTHNIYLVDAPEAAWAGCNHSINFTRVTGQEVLGAFYRNYVKSSNGTVSWADRAIASNGSASVSSGITATTLLAATTGQSVTLTDAGGHLLFDLPGTNVIGAQDGSGGIATFSGVWSSLTRTVPGSGSAAATFLNTAWTLNQVAYGVCYPANLAAVSKYDADPNLTIKSAEEALRVSLERR